VWLLPIKRTLKFIAFLFEKLEGLKARRLGSEEAAKVRE
jgi:hypothetical protein